MGHFERTLLLYSILNRFEISFDVFYLVLYIQYRTLRSLISCTSVYIFIRKQYSFDSLILFKPSKLCAGEVFFQSRIHKAFRIVKIVYHSLDTIYIYKIVIKISIQLLSILIVRKRKINRFDRVYASRRL